MCDEINPSTVCTSARPGLRVARKAAQITAVRSHTALLQPQPSSAGGEPNARSRRVTRDKPGARCCQPPYTAASDRQNGCRLADGRADGQRAIRRNAFLCGRPPAAPAVEKIMQWRPAGVGRSIAEHAPSLDDRHRHRRWSARQQAKTSPSRQGRTLLDTRITSPYRTSPTRILIDDDRG